MRALLDLILPPSCPGCGREGDLLCERCRAPLRRRLAEPPGAPLGMPADLPGGILQLEWCGTYSGPVRDTLHALKYRGERRLAGPLADAMAERWCHAGRGGDLLTWVPAHASRRRDRGFDQAQELAEALAARLDLPVAGCLERRQRTTAQHALGRDQRVDNTSAAFVAAANVQGRLEGRWLIIVDDIVTTGATLSACAAALRETGCRAVSAITVARDR